MHYNIYLSNFSSQKAPMIPVTVTKFPGGEPNVIVNDVIIWLNVTDSVSVYTRLNTSDDLITLLMLCDIIKRYTKRISLFIPYIPGGRMDRMIFENQSFSLQLYAKLINSIDAEKVTTVDPHSVATNTIINNLYTLDIHKHVAEYIGENYLPKSVQTSIIVVVPDAGAIKRSQLYVDALHYIAEPNKSKIKDITVIQAEKVRDNSGKITSTKVKGAFTTENTQIWIFDDICDGGATFIALADAIKELGVVRDNLYLFVTHGIFSKGFKELTARFHAILTTDSRFDAGDAAWQLANDKYLFKIQQIKIQV